MKKFIRLIKKIIPFWGGSSDTLNSTKVNCMILGAAKSGTTSLANYLAEHPEISLGVEKELHYFDWNYIQDHQWYEAGFKKNVTYRIDATPYYLFHPLAPNRIHDYNPSCKFIVLLRNPVERAISHYYHNMRLMELKKSDPGHWGNLVPLDENLSLTEAMKKEEERIASLYDVVYMNSEDRAYHNHALQHFSYKARGRYAEQLKRWYTYFPPERFLLLDFDTLIHSPKKTLNQVYEFLGIKKSYPKKFEKFNEGSYSQSEEVKQLMNELADYYDQYDADLVALTNQRFQWMDK